MRAREPDHVGTVTSDGIRIGYEIHGAGRPTVMLMPTWTLLHVRFWKFQIPHLARRHRVITFDGPGNGRSERSTDPDHYTPEAYARHATAVLDAGRADDAVAVGVSLGGLYALTLARDAPDRVRGLVLSGPSLPLAPPLPERRASLTRFFDPPPADADGWDTFNLSYWHRRYVDFLWFFFSQLFSEPHSTKAREDAVGWALETTPEILAAEAQVPAPHMDPDPVQGQDHPFGHVDCPILIVEGSEDRIHNPEVGEIAARLLGADLLKLAGGGHFPLMRDPVRFNLALSEFVESVAA